MKLALEIATQVAAGLAIVADEALTSGHPYYHYTTTCDRMTTSMWRAVQSGHDTGWYRRCGRMS